MTGLKRINFGYHNSLGNRMVSSPRASVHSPRPHDPQIELGYSITLTLAPKLLGGRLCLNFARTTPEFPCDLVILPHMTLILVPRRSLVAR